jgi:hypothetical protein
MGRSTELLTWVGSTDLRAPTDEIAVGLGDVLEIERGITAGLETLLKEIEA